jgi:hypothetical protein
MMALCLASPGALASVKQGTAKTKPSTAHTEAVKKCNDDYQSAKKQAKALKGQARKDALAAAHKTRKECMTNAPK